MQTNKRTDYNIMQTKKLTSSKQHLLFTFCKPYKNTMIINKSSIENHNIFYKINKKRTISKVFLPYPPEQPHVS